MGSVPRLPLTLVLDNVRSAYNVGSMLRTADSAWIDGVMTTGITPPATHPRVKKTALGAETTMRSAHHATLSDAVRTLRTANPDIIIYALERTNHAVSLWDIPPQRFAGGVGLILGGERDGVQLDITRGLGIGEISLPQFGIKESLNVASAAAIAVYHIRYILTQSGLLTQGNRIKLE